MSRKAPNFKHKLGRDLYYTSHVPLWLCTVEVLEYPWNTKEPLPVSCRVARTTTITTSLFQLNFTALPKDGSGKNAFYIRLPGIPILYDEILNWSTDSDATSFYAKLPFAAGATVAKVIVDTTGQDTANWKTSTTSINCEKGGDKGTPGKLNTYLCPTKPPTKAPTKIPTKASSRTPTKKPTVTLTRLLTTKQPTKTPTSPLAPADSPTGVKPTTGHKRCGLLGLSFVCFNGCGMFGRLLNICQQ
jgi:hypothetical protein